MNTLLSHEERVAIARLHALLELLPTALDKRLRPAGITSFEYTLLEALAEADGQFMRIGAVATKTNATLPRISRVVTSLERRDLVSRAPCAEDARATNLVLTESGTETYARSRYLYATAVRELVLDGVESLPGNGAGHLADLSYAILSSIDPDRKGGFAHTNNDPNASPKPGQLCDADPESLRAADPEQSLDAEGKHTHLRADLATA